MATVMIGIDGKTLRFACEEGDEARLLNLAQKFDSYIGRLKAEHGEIGDYRLSIMAGIMVLDEMNEQARRLEQADTEKKALAAAHETALKAASVKEQALTQKLDTIAQRIIVAAGKITPKA
ncbi:MAG: cell division protein ZapA [Candidatus Tokpelaia sp.]|nr:MAG: cell division protein ZapA [Candidatus Tokpelaia sp.]KAA6207013.1 MAG: cell division protein ZapA [Candidatus Tokpelaia sp.]